MMRALPPLVRRVLAVAMLVLPLVSLYLLLVEPLRDDLGQTRAKIERLTALRDGYRRIADRAAAQRAQLASLEERQAAQDGFLKGGNETLLAAELQNRLKSLVDAAQGELQSTEVLPVQEVDGGKFRRIAVRGQMALTVPAAQQVLYGLEAATPQLFVDNLDLHTHVVELRRQWSEEDVVRLDVKLDVYGYERSGN
jgi:hypothetical protein